MKPHRQPSSLRAVSVSSCGVEQGAVAGRQAQRGPGVKQEGRRHREGAQQQELAPVFPGPALLQAAHDEGQCETGQRHTAARQHHGPDHGAGDADEQEGRAPERGQAHELGEVAGFHQAIVRSVAVRAGRSGARAVAGRTRRWIRRSALCAPGLRWPGGSRRCQNPRRSRRRPATGRNGGGRPRAHARWRCAPRSPAAA